jgi:hypothetical protein
MIAPESSHPDAAGVTAERPEPLARGEQPVTTLRGAHVDVDIRRTGQVVLGVCLAALVVAAAILLVAGIHSNGQINQLRQRGVPVSVTVTGCLGLMGGTGAQSAGYSCTGTYALEGARYRQAIPGLAFHATGTRLQGVAVPGDPKLFSTPDQVATQHSTWRVFVIPGLLLAIVIAVSALVVRRRSSRTPDGLGAVEPR